MIERWLRPNFRVMLIGMVPPCLFLTMGFVLSIWFIRTGAALPWQLLAYGLSVTGGGMLSLIIYHIVLPRLAFQDGHLLVYLRSFRPIRVPIEVVECFFLGQAPSMLPADNQGKVPEAVALIVRLAEKAGQWKQQEVKPALGRWCDGYITIRGSWCEPLSSSLVKRLNSQLAKIHRERKKQQAQEIS